MLDAIKNALGLDVDSSHLTVLQVSLRGVIIFFYALFLVRIGAKRFMARMTALDVILAFILASTLSRAVNGSGPFLPTLVVSALFVLLHRLLSKFAMHSIWMGNMVKGREAILVENGMVHKERMYEHSISDADLAEELRLNGSVCSPAEVKQATLERSGHISVIKAKD